LRLSYRNSVAPSRADRRRSRFHIARKERELTTGSSRTSIRGHVSGSTRWRNASRLIELQKTEPVSAILDFADVLDEMF
jgi:hypothetical protein